MEKRVTAQLHKSNKRRGRDNLSRASCCPEKGLRLSGAALPAVMAVLVAMSPLAAMDGGFPMAGWAGALPGPVVADAVPVLVQVGMVVGTGALPGPMVADAVPVFIYPAVAEGFLTVGAVWIGGQGADAAKSSQEESGQQSCQNAGHDHPFFLMV